MRLTLALLRLGRAMAALYILRSPVAVVTALAALIYTLTGSFPGAAGFAVGAVLLIYMPVDER